MQEFESYDYMTLTIDENRVSQYIDGYENFGWKLDENVSSEKAMGKITLHLKRSRAILNKTELIRLQRHYEACMNEISALESSGDSYASIVSLSVGIAGLAFIAGAVFAITAEEPIIWIMILLQIPGFILCFLAYPLYKRTKISRSEKIEPLIETKLDEADQVCRKAHALLGIYQES